MSSSAIPIANIYYLLCYAWYRLDEAELTGVDAASSTHLAELFGRVLGSGVTHLLKRGLDRAYITEREVIPGIRGRLEIAGSLKLATFPRGQALCAFDELSTDVLHNQIIKTTLRRLASAVSNADLASSLRDLYRRMPGVREITLADQAFRRVMLGRNNSYYGFLLDVCEIVFHNLLVDGRSGAVKFRDFTRDDTQMAQLFERFLLNFYRREAPEYTVGAPQLRWRAEGDPEHLAYLPGMRMDVVLRNRDRIIVMDAKYYAETLTGRFGRETIRSGHLYQLFAYATHLAGVVPRESVTGILIYPRTTQTVQVQATVCGHPFIVSTLDLAQKWPGIRSDLLQLIPGAPGLSQHQVEATDSD